MLSCLAAGLLLQAGCGDSAEDPRPAIRQTLVAVTRAFENGDARAVCTKLSHQARIEIGSIAHNSPVSCIRDLRLYAKLLRLGPREPDSSRLAIEAIAVDNDRASVRARIDGAPVGTIPMVETEDGWKVDYVSGVGQPLEMVTTGPRSPLPTGQPVSAKTAGPRRTPCSAIAVRDMRDDYEGLQAEARGGCLLFGRAEGVKIAMRTLFGTIDFGTCNGRYSFRVDGHGRTWIESFWFSGPSGCPDVTNCARSRLNPLWKGRNHGEGRLLEDREHGLVNVVHACIATCVGRFEGTMAFELFRKGGAWRARAVPTGHPLGIELPGTWKFAIGDFRSS